MNRIIAIVFLSCFVAAPAFSGQEDFTMGPVFSQFGPSAVVETTYETPKDTLFKVSFDVSQQADTGALNGHLVSAARFINMHARAGVPTANIDLAIVIHGGASKDVTNAAYYDAAMGGENANATLIKALIGEGVEIIVCGQSAAFNNVDTDDLLPGVEMALSAMTAHALLQQQGYTLNPF